MSEHDARVRELLKIPEKWGPGVSYGPCRSFLYDFGQSFRFAECCGAVAFEPNMIMWGGYAENSLYSCTKTGKEEPQYICFIPENTIEQVQKAQKERKTDEQVYYQFEDSGKPYVLTYKDV